MSVPRMRLSRAACRSVDSGHPWIYREEPARVPAGTVVDLLDGSGARVGWGLADDGPIAVRVLGPHPRTPIPALLAQRVSAADQPRTGFVDDRTDAYRIVNGAGDGLDGLVVDRYADLAVLRVYAAAWEPHLDAIVSAIAALPWCRTIARRLGVGRVDGGAGAEVLAGPAPQDAIVVEEHGMRLLARWTVGQKTGLFLDQREHRALVRRWARGRDVANLFAYTGGFSVAAALGGAARVWTVDIAADAIADARENFRLNGLDPDDAQFTFDAADAFTWRAPARPTFTIVDPPSLARDKAAEAAAVGAYRKLHRHHGEQLAVGGLLATSSCTARVGVETWREAVAAGLRPVGRWSWHHTSAEPPDHPVGLGHPEGAYLKFALLARRSAVPPGERAVSGRT